MKNIHKNRKACLPMRQGFTLVELMITIAIVGILSSVTIVSLQSGKTKKSLETASREVVAAIREAQNNALSGKGASSSCAEYNFVYTKNSSDYHIGGSGCPTTNYTLKNGVTFSSDSGSFSFGVPFGKVSGAASIQITKGGGSNNYCIHVTDQGGVYEAAGAC